MVENSCLYSESLIVDFGIFMVTRLIRRHLEEIEKQIVRSVCSPILLRMVIKKY